MSEIEGLTKDIPYDLRQVYAIELLGEHLKDVARARKIDNFSMYFKCLKDVYIVVQHKFKDKKNAENRYYKLMKEVVSLANKYPFEWLGQGHNPQPFAEIEKALNDVEMFLYDEIEKAKIFGSAKEIPGL